MCEREGVYVSFVSSKGTVNIHTYHVSVNNRQHIYDI